MLDAARPRSLFLLAEEVRLPPEEGYDRTAAELSRAFAARVDLGVHFTVPTPTGRTRRRLRRSLRRMLGVLGRQPRRAIRRQRPDTVLYMSRAGLTRAALVRCALLKLTTRRPVAMLDLQGSTAPPRTPLPRRLRPDRLLAASPAVVSAAPAGLAVLIQVGVDLQRFRPVAGDERCRLRTKWGLDGAPVVLHVGHLRHGRNLEALIPLAGAYRVVVVASGRNAPESDALHDRLRRSGVRVYRGYEPAVQELYQAADCYVFPTLSGHDALALPLSVLEALACDLPVATTRFGALAKHFDGSAGVRFFETQEELSASLEVLVHQRPATRHLAERFSWPAVADGLLAELRP